MIGLSGRKLASSADEATLFERFVNYIIYSLDYPGIFTGNEDLLDSVCVGGPEDTGIDGLGIKVNDSLVSSTNDIEEIAAISRKIDVEFIFIQSKKSTKFDIAELSSFGNGVKNFLADKAFLSENAKIKAIREVKDFIYSDQKIISKLDHHPDLFLYYVTTGIEPTDPTFTGIQKHLKDELSERIFANVEVKTVGGKQLIKFCRELENKFDVQINVLDIFPLTVDRNEDIKKAYAFTCQASEFMKVLSKEDGSLRRSLFNNNVRDYLGNKGAINNEIETTINTDPEMFLLCNNGITIVCTEFDQIRDKLVRIENPQIVNGCQTSNCIFNSHMVSGLNKIKLLVKLISTDNHSITNMIVRGTNKQNQVLDEAFEGTSPFHQDVLEPFFISLNHDPKIYYERRARQYSNDPLIKKTQIVNLRILTQTFVSMFLNSPHESHRHEAKLLEKYASDNQSRKIFKEEHGPYPYYVCGLTWYMFEKYFKELKINPKYKTYRFHLFWIFRMSLGEFPPVLSKTKVLEDYCQKLMNLLGEPNSRSKFLKSSRFLTTPNLNGALLKVVLQSRTEKNSPIYFRNWLVNAL